jgi:hypothetical protein
MESVPQTGRRYFKAPVFAVAAVAWRPIRQEDAAASNPPLISSVLAKSSRENADDRLSGASLRRIEGGDRIVQT